MRYFEDFNKYLILPQCGNHSFFLSLHNLEKKSEVFMAVYLSKKKKKAAIE